jgi:uncharacterized membrane protein
VNVVLASRRLILRRFGLPAAHGVPDGTYPRRLRLTALVSAPSRGDAMQAAPPKTPQQHPVVAATLAERTSKLQLRIADRITTFAGSMPFVYIHAAVFLGWMLLVEGNPWPTLTLIVSLEAIFLSAFVLIGQNRQAAFQQAKADHDFNEQELELKTNTELTRAIHVLTTELHRRLLEEPTR